MFFPALVHLHESTLLSGSRASVCFALHAIDGYLLDASILGMCVCVCMFVLYLNKVFTFAEEWKTSKLGICIIRISISYILDLGCRSILFLSRVFIPLFSVHFTECCGPFALFHASCPAFVFKYPICYVNICAASQVICCCNFEFEATRAGPTVRRRHVNVASLICSGLCPAPKLICVTDTDRTHGIRHENIGESFYGNAHSSREKQCAVTSNNRSHVWDTRLNGFEMMNCAVDVIFLKCSCKHYHRHAILLFRLSRPLPLSVSVLPIYGPLDPMILRLFPF